MRKPAGTVDSENGLNDLNHLNALNVKKLERATGIEPVTFQLGKLAFYR